MNRLLKKLFALAGVMILILALAAPAFAAAPEEESQPAEAQEDADGALGMGLATAKSAEGIARQPEAEGKIRTMMMLGLVFIETAIIYALLVVILIIFVL